MTHTKDTSKETWEEVMRKMLETFITDFYFIHCQPKKVPEFKTAAEYDAWAERAIFVSSSVIQNEVERWMHSITKEVAQAKSEGARELIERIGNMNAPHQAISEYYSGYNKAIKDIVATLREDYK